MQRKFTIELGEVVCLWLEHISHVTGQSIEDVISNGIYHQVGNLEESAKKAFTFRE